MRNRWWTWGINRWITPFVCWTPEYRYVLAIGIGPLKFGIHFGKRRRFNVEQTP